MQAISAKYGLQVSISIIGALTLYLLNGMRSDFQRMTESVEKLNTTMAAVVDRISTHDKRIERLEAITFQHSAEYTKGK